MSCAPCSVLSFHPQHRAGVCLYIAHSYFAFLLSQLVGQMLVSLSVGVLGGGRASARAAWAAAPSRAGFAASFSAVARLGDGALGRTALVLSTIYERPRLPFARLRATSLSAFQDRSFRRAFSATAGNMVRAVFALFALLGTSGVAVLHGRELWWLWLALLTCVGW